MTPRLALAAAVVVAALGSSAAAPARGAADPAGTTLTPVKAYLLRHTTLLLGFTERFRVAADRYYAAARSTGFDYATLSRTRPCS